MIFECKFRRNHQTQTKQLKIGEAFFEVDVRDEFKLDVEAVVDLRQPEARKVFIQGAIAFADTARPADSTEWGRTRFMFAVEKQPEKPLPKPLVKEGSLAELLIRECARENPTLYLADQYTPYRVLEQWFMTYGNAMDWRSDGILIEHRETASVETLRERVQQLLQTPLPDGYLDELNRAEEIAQDENGAPRPNVRLYPLDDADSAIFLLPDGVEDSFLCAAVDVCRYFLSRPVWECYCDGPHEREGQSVAVYETREGRELVLKDGMVYREKIESAYSQIVERFRTRLELLGWVDEVFVPDLQLPPAVILQEKQTSTLNPASLSRLFRNALL